MPDTNSGQSTKSALARKKLLGLLAILLAVSGVLIWEEALRDRVIPKRFGVVREGYIYRSGQLSAALVKKVLVKYNIRVIVDLTSDDPKDSDQQAEKNAAAELGIEVVRLPLRGMARETSINMPAPSPK